MSRQYRLHHQVGNRIIVPTAPRFEEGTLDLPPDVEAESSETMVFDPMEANPLKEVINTISTDGPLEVESDDDVRYQLLVKSDEAQNINSQLTKLLSGRGHDRGIDTSKRSAVYRIPMPNSYQEAIGDGTHGADWILAARGELAQL
ncbi:hypothetical protein VC83_03519 [Pseudogymnoascus destructans]|uniref:Uncharacterized protein n=2 Tax=Pseudogymnoascus destructans TaxID=655981 RepID=L8G5H1_PSED2|nr:uncharacterized protein VC83_03519 [Pseudogymnoascus destructans]ELR08377.1 hypothetical protein GMDG_03166 [Pseudogymnoascus destructans 20631-21]OAF60525.1 hypothetical protein VC83_03519 [Pseudogymnoascus destructans]